MAKENKRKEISFTYGDEHYDLCFTADSLKKMQNSGFNFGDMNSRLITFAEDLFSGSFIAKHPNVPRKKRLEIYHELVETNENGDSIIDTLIEMVNEAIDEINYHSGNIKWEVHR